MSRVIAVRAPAKINLYLHVTGKREDGYHMLDSWAVFTDAIADIVTIRKSDCFSFSLSGPFAETLSQEDEHKNLAVRAAKLFCEITQTLPAFSLHLEKNIPMGAGLGGGSSDAAAVIKALEEFYGINLPERDAHLLTLGADVPVCYRAKTLRFEGIGESIGRAPALPACSLLILWPGQHSATKDVFQKRDGGFSPRANLPDAFDNISDITHFLKTTRNDLSDAAQNLIPEIARAENYLAAQEGCLLTRMSGSGSAVFGIFSDPQLAENAAARCPYPWAKTALIGNK